jgi:hypothetical protein
MSSGHKFGYEWTVLKSKSIQRWYAFEEDEPILQWQKQLVFQCDGNPAYLERKITTPGYNFLFVKNCINRIIEEYGVVF